MKIEIEAKETLQDENLLQDTSANITQDYIETEDKTIDDKSPSGLREEELKFCSGDLTPRGQEATLKQNTLFGMTFAGGIEEEEIYQPDDDDDVDYKPADIDENFTT